MWGCAQKTCWGLGWALHVRGERTCSPGVGVRDDTVGLVRAGAGEPWPCAGSAVAMAVWLGYPNLVCCFAASCLSFACSCAQEVLYNHRSEREGGGTRGAGRRQQSITRQSERASRAERQAEQSVPGGWSTSACGVLVLHPPGIRTHWGWSTGDGAL